jgi:transposase
MSFTHFIGIDISKKTFDLALINENAADKAITAKFSNNHKGIVRLEQFIRKQELVKQQVLFCIEHTGLYCRVLSNYLVENQYAVWLEMPAQILRSLGIQRGKTDQVDAKRIATYAFTFRAKARLWQPPREEVQKIHDLMALRDRLVESRKSILTPIQELEATGLDEVAATLRKHCQKSIDSLDKEIKQIEKELDEIIDKDTNLKNKYKLARSVPGIGKITAMTLLYFTNEFTLFRTAKELACYCGVAPFARESGTSVRGKTRVSNFANKVLKKLLHMASMAAISSDKELKAFFERKVAEGKNKMLVLNAIRNKLLHRLVAVIKRNSPFQSEYEPV